ncbi:MAG: hypothetical protein IT305_17950 [Chloroflexi bacterium]|nr:hypothetical protein [Chloroflexota bacterium]
MSIKLLAQRRHREGNPIGQKLGHIWVFDENEVREIAGIPNRRGRPGKEKKPSADVDFGKLPQ